MTTRLHLDGATDEPPASSGAGNGASKQRIEAAPLTGIGSDRFDGETDAVALPDAKRHRSGVSPRHMGAVLLQIQIVGASYTPR